MKLRIHKNSIRLRLGRSDVESLADDGLLRETLRFPDGAELSYALESSPASVVPTAHLEGGGILVRLPEDLVSTWARSERISISEDVDLGPDGQLAILVEKDFACLTPREGDDDADSYPHPKAG